MGQINLHVHNGGTNIHLYEGEYGPTILIEGEHFGAVLHRIEIRTNKAAVRQLIDMMEAEYAKLSDKEYHACVKPFESKHGTTWPDCYVPPRIYDHAIPYHTLEDEIKVNGRDFRE